VGVYEAVDDVPGAETLEVATYGEFESREDEATSPIYALADDVPVSDAEEKSTVRPQGYLPMSGSQSSLVEIDYEDMKSDAEVRTLLVVGRLILKPLKCRIHIFAAALLCCLGGTSKTYPKHKSCVLSCCMPPMAMVGSVSVYFSCDVSRTAINLRSGNPRVKQRRSAGTGVGDLWPAGQMRSV